MYYVVKIIRTFFLFSAVVMPKKNNEKSYQVLSIFENFFLSLIVQSKQSIEVCRNSNYSLLSCKTKVVKYLIQLNIYLQ